MITKEQLEYLWNLMILNYGETHNDLKHKQLFFHFIKKHTHSYKQALKVVEDVMEVCRYYPNTFELLSVIPKEDTQEKPKWFDEDLKVKTPTEEEQKELDDLIKELSK